MTKYSKLPTERFKYYPDAEEGIVRSMGQGILFLMVFWNGPSVQAFAKLTEM